jgi:hypothetical protein
MPNLLLLVGDRQPPSEQLLIVGERHGRGNGAAFSGDGSSGRRLGDLLGAPVTEVASTVNLIAGRWDPLVARRRALALHDWWPGRIVACGRRAADAFGIDEFLVWHDNVGAIPHPSGRCRYWNDPAHVESARRFLRGALNGHAPSR